MKQQDSGSVTFDHCLQRIDDRSMKPEEESEVEILNKI